MDDTASIRRAIEALATNNYCRRYPVELRARIAAHTRRELSAGRTLWEVARSLGMAGVTLSRFMTAHSATALVPVRVVDAKQGSRCSKEILIHTPGGLTVEGLELPDVVTLLRALT